MIPYPANTALLVPWLFQQWDTSFHSCKMPKKPPLSVPFWHHHTRYSHSPGVPIIIKQHKELLKSLHWNLQTSPKPVSSSSPFWRTILLVPVSHVLRLIYFVVQRGFYNPVSRDWIILCWWFKDAWFISLVIANESQILALSVTPKHKEIKWYRINWVLNILVGA